MVLSGSEMLRSSSAYKPLHLPLVSLVLLLTFNPCGKYSYTSFSLFVVLR